MSVKKGGLWQLDCSEKKQPFTIWNLEGNLRGEAMVEKLGDIFNLFNQVRQVNFPPPLIEEYIDLEIESQQLVNIELPSKSHFKEVIKMEVKIVGIIPIIQWIVIKSKTHILVFKDSCTNRRGRPAPDPSSSIDF